MCCSLDYIANSDYIYTFTSDTRSLPIQTQLVADRAGEGIENFMICLPIQLQVTSPNCVDITIIDDDCKYIIQFHLAYLLLSLSIL